MATFPEGIYSPRTKENRSGAVYDANKKTITFAEDVIYLDEEVVAIETFLLNKEKLVRVPSEVFKVPGVKPASVAELGIGSALEFEDAKEEIAFAKINLPLDMDRTIQPKIHIEFSSSAQSLNCKWKIEYLWRAIDEEMNAAAEDTITDVYESSAVAWGLAEAEIQLAGLAETDAFLVIRVTRLGADGEDTLGASAFLSCVCLEYISDKLGGTP